MLSEISSTHPIVFTIIWQSSLFITAGLIASYLCKRHPARAHQVLLLSMIAAVVVPFLTIAVKHLELGIFMAEPGPSVEYVDTSEVSVQSYDNPLPDFVPAGPVEPEKLGLPWSKILLAGWIAASVIFLARLILTFILGIRLVKKTQPFEFPKIAESIKAAASKLGIKENMVIYSSQSVPSPAIWCWKRRPVLLLPSDKSFLNDKIDLVGIICHELAHLKRHDHVAGLMSEFMVVFLPWHPLLWWTKKRLSGLSELACDDWVIAVGGCGMNYAESLLNLVPSKQMAFVPAVVRNKNVLKGRVIRMLKERYGNPRLSKKWILSTILITTCITLTVAFAQTRSARPEEEANLEYTINPLAVSQGVPISEEADAALKEAQQRFEADPENPAAAREPLIEYVETHPLDSIPPEMFQMLAQFWFMDEKNENHIEEASRVYATGFDMFPDNGAFLFGYANIAHMLGQAEDAALLLENYYNRDENHDPKYLEEAAMAYVHAGNMSEAKRVYSRLIDLVETPKGEWFDEVIRICREMGDQEEAKHYLRQALDYYPTDDSFYLILASIYFDEGDEQVGNKVLQEAGLTPQSESGTTWKANVHVPDGLPDEDGVYDLAEVHDQPRILNAHPPTFPMEAKENGITGGRVVVEWVVTTEGLPRDEWVVKAEPAGVFEDAAIEAVRQYRFKPATRNGEPVEVRVKLPVIFALE